MSKIAPQILFGSVFPALCPHPEDVVGPVAGPAQVVEHEEAARSHGRRRPGVDALRKKS